ncbi:hypothetical protein KFE25_000842 [Diacronema lutheri]|uniref:RNA helicase n=1 Tax=Diacronema lutheri TaxID=2081491 RepID=A0A8J6CDW4_DIALT|nr:hypothetical protein KFE25_000842 [Diacronema lutheri]
MAAWPGVLAWFLGLGLAAARPSAGLGLASARHPSLAAVAIAARRPVARRARPASPVLMGATIDVLHVDEVGAATGPDGVDFNSLGLLAEPRHATLRDNLRRMGVSGPNMVQAHSAPLLLSGRDLVLHASTGSGKTLAFVLPAMSNVVEPQAGVQLLILCPSKELAMQTHRSCTALLEGSGLSSLPLVGGVNVARQEERLRKERPEVIVATPRRLVELALGNAKKLKLGSVRAVVVDEVDDVLRPPHAADLRHLLAHTRRAASDARDGARVQLVFASATGDAPAVRAAACELMREPALLSVHRRADARGLPPTISHGVMRVRPQKRIESLKRILSMEPRPQALAFVSTAQEADFVAEKLNELGVADVMPVRSSQERDERVTAMQRLLSGKLRAIVCTDIAARGLDVPSLSIVVNMDPPDDGRRYVHRAGRCGRAGRAGAVITIVSSDAQESAVRALAAKLGITLRQVGVFGGALRWDQADDDATAGGDAGGDEPTTRGGSVDRLHDGGTGRVNPRPAVAAAARKSSGEPSAARSADKPRAAKTKPAPRPDKLKPPRSAPADRPAAAAGDRKRSPAPARKQPQPRGSGDFTIL